MATLCTYSPPVLPPVPLPLHPAQTPGSMERLSLLLHGEKRHSGGDELLLSSQTAGIKKAPWSSESTRSKQLCFYSPLQFWPIREPG